MPATATPGRRLRIVAIARLCITLPLAACATSGTPEAETASGAEPASAGGAEGGALGVLPRVERGSSADSPRTHQGLLIARATLDAAMPEPPDDRSYAALQRWVDTEVVAWVERRRAQTQEVRERFELEGQPNESEQAVSRAVLGLIHEDTARSLRSIPAPAELDTEPEIAEMYRDIVSVQADTFLNSALVEFRDCANGAYRAEDDMRPFAVFCHERFDRLDEQLSARRKVAAAGAQPQ
jgi:hypothetical protein